MYLCIYVCMNVRTYIDVCMYVLLGTKYNWCMYVRTYVHTYVRVCLCVCVGGWTDTCVDRDN